MRARRFEEQMGKWQASLRLHDGHGARALHAQRPADRRRQRARHLAVEPGAVSIGAIAVVTGLVMRIVAMSGWILWVVAGIFENIGVVQEGMETISRANQVVDRAGQQAAGRAPGRDPLRAHQLPLRAAGGRRHGAARRRSSTTCRCTSRRARRSAWSAARAPASRRSSTCCCASTTWSAAAS